MLINLKFQFFYAEINYRDAYCYRSTKTIKGEFVCVIGYKVHNICSYLLEIECVTHQKCGGKNQVFQKCGGYGCPGPPVPTPMASGTPIVLISTSWGMTITQNSVVIARSAGKVSNTQTTDCFLDLSAHALKI